jgi:glycosyltransferase involved in cell wall biosynthesis
VNTFIHRANNESVMYLNSAGPKPKLIQQIMNEHSIDLVYINSLFSLKYSIVPLLFFRRKGLLKHVIIAPRGMLKSGALALKARKKNGFLKLAKVLQLHQGVNWAASTATERDEIRQHIGTNARVHIAPNLPRLAKPRVKIPNKESGELRLITVARVSQEKNILGAIEYLVQAANQPVMWSIYGTYEEGNYIASCRQAAEKNKHIQLTFHGEIAPHHLADVMAEAHIFYLPTLGENYGHAIVEALIVGLPVLISDRTPWQNLEALHAGWSLPLNGLAFVHALTACFALDQNAYNELCEGAQKYGQAIAHDALAVQQNLELFEFALQNH